MVPPLDEAVAVRADAPGPARPRGVAPVGAGPGGPGAGAAGPAAAPRRDADPAGEPPGSGRRTLAARLGLEGLRLTARGRFAVAVVTLVLAAPVVWGATAVASSPEAPVEVRSHAVEPGETLWGLAASIAEPGQDVRDVVRRLQDLNDLPTGGLTVGQTLYVPAG
ncbi:hypothetical protein GCM10027059_01210 [Myceligenerans halotolerans]